MDVIFIVLPVALVLGGVALAAFLWSVRSGQFEDLDTPGIRVALDDDRPVKRTDAAEAERHEDV